MHQVDNNSQEIEERPAGYIGPDLNPAGLELEPQMLSEGVYALMANTPPKDNNGVIIGERGALVIDAGINGDIARQIQHIIQQLTDKPLLYVVNTTYHGDHSFGNSAFPAEVKIVSSRQNRASMRDLEREKRIRSENMKGNLAALADVVEWRLPDIFFDHFMAIDLGNKIVELWHFGPGNAPGDTIVYIPDAQVAWTGNFTVKDGFAPMLLEGGPGPYIETIQKMQATLPAKILIPGHGPIAEAGSALESLVAYLQTLQQQVSADIKQGLSLDETLAAHPLPDTMLLPPTNPLAPVANSYNIHAHRLNVLATYRALERK
jgi:cyclase